MDHDFEESAQVGGAAAAAHVVLDGEREQDRFLPVANIARIMKRVLPGNTKIAKDAKEAIQACVSEFISFVTSEASDKCQLEKRKTINGEDLLWAMNTLGFDQYSGPLLVYLNKYRESVKGEKPGKLTKTEAVGSAALSVAAASASSLLLTPTSMSFASPANSKPSADPLATAAAAAPAPAATTPDFTTAAGGAAASASTNYTTTVTVLDFLGISICDLAASCISQQFSSEQAVTAGLTALNDVLRHSSQKVDETTTTTLQFHMTNFMSQEFQRQVQVLEYSASRAK